MINRVLGVAALILGGTALLMPAGQVPDPEHSASIAAHYDLIAAESLAVRIIERGTEGLTLVDLRTDSAFREYHLPGAIQLRDTDLGRAQLPEGTAIVLYDELETDAARVWVLLKAQGYREVYVLSGGMAGWEQEVLHPALPPGIGRASTDSFADRLERSRFFGGTPVPARAHPVAPRPAPDTARTKPESFDIGPGGCFY